MSTAVRYGELLVDAGIVRGLLGPREADRIWERHLLNSAVVAELIPEDAWLIDVGSGAGLPGIPLALARPSAHVLLLEPLARRCAFLEEVVTELGLADRVTVMRGRAPEAVVQLPFLAEFALARAVAPLERLVSWTMPVVQPGGSLLALRGERAEQELLEAGPGLARYGAGASEVVEIGGDLLGTPVRVVRVPRTQAGLRKGDARVQGKKKGKRGR
ncbi:MAG: rRNA methyltransferase [Mycobacterium sp.]|nr:rRNA methyltransferase [Mycobacterium sp.]